MEQRLEPFFDLPDEQARHLRHVLGEESPNFGEIVFGRFGYLEDERSFNAFCPFRMILSASKTLTRASAMS